jgi:hypothetical protein
VTRLNETPRDHGSRFAVSLAFAQGLQRRSTSGLAINAVVVCIHRILGNQPGSLIRGVSEGGSTRDTTAAAAAAGVLTGALGASEETLHGEGGLADHVVAAY